MATLLPEANAIQQFCSYSHSLNYGGAIALLAGLLQSQSLCRWIRRLKPTLSVAVASAKEPQAGELCLSKAGSCSGDGPRLQDQRFP